MKRTLSLWAVFGFCLAAHAHRLDEYLQATRIGLELTRIEVNIDLTPGVSIAPKLLSLIDQHNREVVPARKAKAYSQRVLADVSLEVDGKPCALKLVRATFPPRPEMQDGEGTIRLRAVAKVRRLRTGAHELIFRNQHLPEISVYLANALAPDTRIIHITRQARDERQQEYRLLFEVDSASSVHASADQPGN